MSDEYVLGTTVFMAPEQFIKDACCNKSVDIWGLGHIFHAILVGEYLFEEFSEDSDALVQKILHEEFDFCNIGLTIE